VKVSIYVRVSTAAQAAEERVSLPAQASELKELAVARGWELVTPSGSFDGVPSGVFGDPGVSGDEIETRPGMMALLEAVKDGAVHAVLVRDTNRLARHELAAQQIHAVLEAHGVRLVTPSMEYEYSNLQHRLMLGLLGSIEAYAKRWLVGNMRRHREAQAKTGRWGESVKLFGYRWDKTMKRPVLAEQEASTVREVFRLAAEGRSCEAIARELTRQGRRTRKGGTWYGYRVTAILRRAEYKGEWFTVQGVRVRPEFAPVRLLPAQKGSPKQESASALVDDATWTQAQATAAAFRGRRRPSVRRKFLLSGMVYCGQCGRMMSVRCPSPKYRYYGCNTASRSRGAACQMKHVRAEHLEREIWSHVLEMARDPALIAEAAEHTKQKRLGEWQSELKESIYPGLKSLRVRDGRARRGYESDVYTLEELARSKAEIEGEREQLQTRQKELEALVSDEEKRRQAVDSTAGILQAVSDLDGLSLEEKRRLLFRLGARVTVLSKDHCRFEWYGEAVSRADRPLAAAHQDS